MTVKIALAPRLGPRELHAAAAVTYAAGLACRPIPRRAGPGRPTTPRGVATYLAVTAGNVTQAAAARALGLSRETVRKAIARLEDRRDEPAVDALLCNLSEAFPA